MLFGDLFDFSGSSLGSLGSHDGWIGIIRNCGGRFYGGLVGKDMRNGFGMGLLEGESLASSFDIFVGFLHAGCGSEK